MEQKGEKGKEFKSQVYHNLISKVTYDYYSCFFRSCCNSLNPAGGKNSAELLLERLGNAYLMIGKRASASLDVGIWCFRLSVMFGWSVTSEHGCLVTEGNKLFCILTVVICNHPEASWWMNCILGNIGTASLALGKLLQCTMFKYNYEDPFFLFPPFFWCVLFWQIYVW